MALSGSRCTLFWLLTDLLLLKPTGKQMHFFYKKMKPGVSFLKACFDPLLKIIVCFSGCSVVSLVFSLSGLRPCNREEKWPHHIDL